jgi:class 3 adenylate cyclase
MHCGEVVVRTIGNDLHMDYSAVGQTTHLAARMEQLAPPGSILLSAATLRLVEGLVQVKALGPMPVKGLTEPMEVFELVGASSVQRRLQAAAARGLTRFVGRETELDALWQALARSGAGHGQVVALMGEAGVGKSRLIYEFTHSHRLQGWLVLESASVSYGKATPYFPVIDLLRRYSHVEDLDDPRTVRARVTGQVLTLDEALQGIIPPLLALLDVLPDDSPFLKLDPPQRRQRALEALKRLLLRETQAQPLLLVFEDLHWIDTETQALLDSLVETLPTAHLLLLVNYRPEYQHGWGSKTYYTQLRLDPLSPASAEDFLQALLGDGGEAQHAAALQTLKQLLIARTQGNPFFLEESVRTLVESGELVGTPGAYRLVKPLEGLHVPATVQAVLAARIDRLSVEEKHLLQTAAVIGTEVSFSPLQAVAELPEDALHRGLSHLQAAEFLYETRLFPEREYTFKHALTHEVAYGSLLQERRRTLHAHIVEALERLAPDRLAEHVERLAHHALRGEVWDKALAYCQQAGVRAWGRAACSGSVVYFEQALQALAHLPEDDDTRVLAVEIRLALGMPLTHLGENGRHLALLGEAEALALALDDGARLGRVLASKAFALLTEDYDGAMAAGQQALTLAAALGDSALQLEASYRLGQVCLVIGDFGRAVELLRRNVEATDWGSDSPGTDVRILSRAWLTRTLSHLGPSPRAGVTGRKRSASLRWEAEGPHRSVPTATSASCASPKGTWSTPSGCWNRAWPCVVPLAARPCCDRSRRPWALPMHSRGTSRRGAFCWRRRSASLSAWVLPGQVMPAGSYGSVRSAVWRDAARRPGSTLARRSTWPGSTRNAVTRRLHCTSLALSRPTTIPPTLCRLKPTTRRRAPWQRNSACARCRPTATSALAPCMPGMDGGRKRATHYLRPSCCTVLWT